MSDPDSSRPRLVSVDGERAQEPEQPAVEEASDSASGLTARRGFWLLVAIALAATAGLAYQTLNAQALQDRNEALAGELFATRSALDAYVGRFADVKDSIAGLQAQIEQLDALVSTDPLAPAPEPTAGPEAAAPQD